MSVLPGLKPAVVWKYFEKICSIPHPSKHERAIADYVKSVAVSLGLEVKEDQASPEAGNVLVTKPARPGHEKAPTLVLQGHLDMVGVARPGVQHDFLKDPIKIKLVDGWVTAGDTTLGADNGIGGAIMLALMEDSELPHGKLEFLFTVDEEAGMTGAHEIQSEFVTGRRLINLDTEEWGEVYISCAGGGDSIVTLPVERAPAEAGQSVLEVKVAGLLGGHSGADIHLGRGVGTKMIARLMAAVLREVPFRLVGLAGGNKRNSIPDWGAAVVAVAAARESTFRAAVEKAGAVLRAEVEKTDPGAKVTVAPAKAEWAPMTAAATRRALELVIALPQGILAMSPEVEGLVETSSNVGTMETTEKHVRTVNLTRSAVTSYLEYVKAQIRTIAEAMGAQVEEPRGYPGWKPDMASELLKVAKETFQRLHGKEPAVKAIHAGLECGLFSEKFKGIDMISIGPNMRAVHSPDEKLDAASVEWFYGYLRELVKAVG